MTALPESFWDKVAEQADGCWHWTGATDSAGYGRFRPHDPTTTNMAHRVAYLALVGPIPDGLQLDHLCRVRKCVNPDHLEPVTARENILRGYGRGANEARQTRCQNGHPLSGDNLYIKPNGRRQCRQCNRDRQTRFREAGPDRLPPDQHGTEYAYSCFGCRCAECSAAASKARRARRERKASA